MTPDELTSEPTKASVSTGEQPSGSRDAAGGGPGRPPRTPLI